ncbi:MAG: peptidylprolyl isomerase [Candidatus Roseilinea sp.]|uniref:peptidylprolyl isomerase n=1 Tax=Candidatus Roseilinea sp. TaxID=2838777 RepID=UPI0040496E04
MSTVTINVVLNFTPTPLEMSTVTPQPAPTVVILAADTPQVAAEPPTEHLAARVNGQEITREQFERELSRYLAADPANPPPDSSEGLALVAQLKDQVLDALIEQALIEQEAKAQNIVIADGMVEEEIQALIKICGGRDKFEAWLAANRHTEDEAREMARHDLMANALRDRVLAQLPRTAEYVHAYHIVVATEAEARAAQARLASGAKFTALAQSLSIDDSTRPSGGDLGWFTRGAGAVLWTEVEDAAFALNPNEISPIVQSPIGFHLVWVTERQTRALTAEDTAYFQQLALSRWIDSLKAKATIEKFLK